MVKLLAKFTALGLSLVLVSACSDQYKIVNPGGTSDDVYAMIDRVQGLGATEQDLLADENSTIYFTKSGTNGLVAESVFSMGNATAFTGAGNSGQEVQNVFQLGLDEVSIAFIDAQDSENECNFMLIIEFNYQTDFGYEKFFTGLSGPGSYSFSDDVFEVYFEGQGDGGKTIVLRTTDLNKDFSRTLGDNVQFQVYVIDGNGSDLHIGQFSTLAGFGS